MGFDRFLDGSASDVGVLPVQLEHITELKNFLGERFCANLTFYILHIKEKYVDSSCHEPLQCIIASLLLLSPLLTGPKVFSHYKRTEAALVLNPPLLTFHMGFHRAQFWGLYFVSESLPL